ncbi:phosphate ABC transporter ATP-binding protein PstB [Salinirubrum litoreum]|uniref:Phosphate ABC transporter ATP-binding protein PstB n=1 Tax=Salinirubrum litoreum TaxID=1126234 RepID=A0ABD5RA19_9EURY|nr:phosphate ABC transporter ATP-binding protein PstB [Salinirubrum litoreum]
MTDRFETHSRADLPAGNGRRDTPIQMTDTPDDRRPTQRVEETPRPTVQPTDNATAEGTGVTGASDRSLADEGTLIEARDLSVYYGDDQALRDVSIEIPENRVTAIIGPSGCGKSTFLRCLNRMNDLIDDVTVEGELLFAGKNVYDDDVDPVVLRRHVGMVFQQPNPFPKSIYENVAYGLRVQGRTDDLDAKVEQALRRAALWDEVNDRLDESGLELSGGQQQRLCIARAIAVDPELLLMDEPASALDPIATAGIEDLIRDLSEEYTVVIVTHNMQQAARVSDYTAVFLTGGELVEFAPTATIFENPDDQRVDDYVSGKFG